MYVLCHNIFFHTKIKLLQIKCFSLTKQENVDWDDYLRFGTQALFCDSVTWYKYVFLITFWVDMSYLSAITSTTGSQKCKWREDTMSSFWVPFF